MNASRVLFVGVGVFWLLIGVLTALLSDKGIGPPMIFISERTDTALYGGPPAEILISNPELARFRYMIARTLAGTLVATGLLTAGVAWFGLTEARTWVLVVLALVGLAVLPYWWISLAPFRDEGIKVTLGDVPPFMWVPAIVMPLASVLGWIGYLRS